MNLRIHSRQTFFILASTLLPSALSAAPGWSMEQFPGIGGPAVSNLTSAATFYTAPTTTVLTSPEIPANSGNNYGTRIRGYIIAPVSGQYTFWESGDDAVQLYLSPDGNPANKQLIAYHSPGTAAQQWDKYPTQKSRQISLEAGGKYYIEALHKEGTGSDHLAIAWTPPGASRTLIPLSSMETFDVSVPSTVQGLTLQMFDNIDGSYVADLTDSPSYPHSPSSTVIIASGQGPVDAGDNFGSRTRGWVVPQFSGDYTFWVCGDSRVELLLSPTGNPADKAKVASCSGATTPQQWTKYGSQKSRTLTLTAGNAYYIEVLQKESTGTDHFTVAWTPPGGTIETLPGNVLRTWAPHPTDLDDDQIADAKEAAFGLDATVAADAYADSDDDGIPNYREYLNGSDPSLLDSVNGHINDHVWFNIPGDKLTSASYKAAATRPYDARSYLTTAQSADVGDNYVRRYRGFVTAPLTGQYQFWLTADDDADLHLSTTSSKFNLVHIIRNEVLGGETSFDIDPSQKSALITLQAGEKYYFEMWHKEQTGSGNAAIAWKVPGGSRQIIPGYYLSSFPLDPDDLDDDDLPDSYEIAYGLNPNDDGRSPGSNEGAYGDLDGDGLTNYEEWKNSTAANLVDSDGDGVSDYDEVNFFGSAILANDIGAFTPIAVLPGDSYSASTAQWSGLGEQAYQESRRGSVTYSITVPDSGIHALKFSISSIADGAKSEQHDFHIKINGQHLAYKTITILPDSTGTLAVLTPWLEEGVAYNIELIVDNSYNYRRVSIEQVEVLAPGGTDSNSNGIPDWTEIRVNDFNSLDSSGTINSKTSPAVLEGKARFPGLLATNAPGAIVPAPNGRFFTEVPLALSNAASPVNLSFAFENNGVVQNAAVHWQATNLRLESAITLRQGDSLLLTAYDDAENASLESYSYTLNGNTISQSSDQPTAQLFSVAGLQTISVTHTAADSTTVTRIVTVTVVARVTLDTPACVVAYSREWTPLGLPAGANLQIDNQVQSIPGSTSGSYILTTSTPINQPVLVRSDTNLILGSGHIKSFSVRGGDTTGLRVSGVIGNNQLVDMPVVAYGDMGTAEIRCVIFQGGVTFTDGTTSNSITAASLDPMHTMLLQFSRPPSAFAVCHEYQVFDGSQRIALF